MTHAETVAVVRMCNALWPSGNLDVAATAGHWAPLLAGLDAAAVTAAVRRMGSEADRRFAPRVGEIATAAKPVRDRTLAIDCDCRQPNCRCTMCDRGWVESRDGQGRWWARPCGVCRPVDAELMRAGHWACAGRRGCAVCKDIVARRGRVVQPEPTEPVESERSLA